VRKKMPRPLHLGRGVSIFGAGIRIDWYDRLAAADLSLLVFGERG